MEGSQDRKVIYQAIFIKKKDVKKLIEGQGEKLSKEVEDIHCTFKFLPSEKEIKKFSELLGKELTLKVVGYCSDGKNSGYEIELSPEQESAYTNSHNEDNEKGIQIVKRTPPHITVSLEEGAKAVDSGMLPFSKEGFEPFIIHGRAGFFTSRIQDNERKTEIIYEPVLKENEKVEKTPKTHDE